MSVSDRDERFIAHHTWTAQELIERIVELEDLVSSITDLHKPEDVSTTVGLRAACITCESDAMQYPYPCPTAEVLMELSHD